ncbi:NAD(P)-dependent dehydrogenase (short-subunit alcohol dehydrogenase family) [Rhodoligotrophos appendicifer]|uniref:SDR family oxidoreductase n=1 Tax=Rhodoligotrophos appendicifer TaxID=987056 RepID=UPI001185BAB8|nr:SDR family oxidoreductase [Rhodoligotrophos appendicifer]
MSIAGQRIVIIGGSSGIGLATAKAAAARGARVVIGGRSVERLGTAAAEIGAETETHALDATDEHAVKAMFEGLGKFDHLAVLVPSAPDKTASTRLVDFLHMEVGQFETVFRNRFWSQLYGIRHGAPHMTPTGSIVLMSSSQPRKTIPRYSASSAAAGAIEALARSLAIELAPIRVNVIAPGFIETPGTSHIPTERRAAWDRIAEAQPVKRLGTPEEIAHGMLFLMENSYATASVLDIDGGYRLT